MQYVAGKGWYYPSTDTHLISYYSKHANTRTDLRVCSEMTTYSACALLYAIIQSAILSLTASCNAIIWQLGYLMLIQSQTKEEIKFQKVSYMDGYGVGSSFHWEP